ncbi:MAG: Eco57I restriction-modification methylase domain-containing protein [Bryobacteraceae bacterium]
MGFGDELKSAVENGASRGILDFSIELEREYEARTSVAARKEKGQFFTPPPVCRFMAGLFNRDFPDAFRLLDPGAGVGSLSAAVCERISSLRSPRRLQIHLFENDTTVLPYLERNLEHCCESLKQAGHNLTYRIHEKDFILDAAEPLFSPPSLFADPDRLNDFDGVIMNPPYFKLSKDSSYARIMDDVVHGQPNIYAFFLAAGAEMLRPGGQLIAITPRSFCNGLYFRDFRRWFLQRMALNHIHLFESRTGTFRDVLQESLITASHRLGEPSASVTITTSFAANPGKGSCRTLPTSLVVDDSCGQLTVRIPASEEDSEIARIVECWPARFSSLGLRVSTGPVVMFRATEFLANQPHDEGTVPLLSVFNVKPFETVWPVPHKKQPPSFKVCAESLRLLLPARNYVLLRRFSAKEERRRLTASCLLSTSLNQPFVALENHLNYVYHAERELAVDEVYGLAALFNSALFDRYFRTFSGNTQVNATELRMMKFPDLSRIASIGNRIRALRVFDPDAVEVIVLAELGIHERLRDHLLEGTLFSQI